MPAPPPSFATPSAAANGADPAVLLAALEHQRERTLGLVADIVDADLERVFTPLLSPLAWDLGHLAAYEDLWLAHRFGGLELLRPDLLAVYDALETPRAARAEARRLDASAARRYLADVRRRVVELVVTRGVGDGLLFELVARHEEQHRETMLQAIALAHLPIAIAEPAGPARRSPSPASGLELIELPAEPFWLGAHTPGFAYDNERPCHLVDLPAFAIGRTPVTNADWAAWMDDGGYERRAWWDDTGWAWKEREQIARPGGWTEDGRVWRLGELLPMDPQEPVVHVSWFEADAFARAHGLRLPHEAEWEKAAVWDRAARRKRRHPWGEQPVEPARANLDALRGGPLPVGALPAGAAASGCLGMLGDVWEWTSGVFAGYPGFRAHPYREYSEIFFDGRYRVLRGGSWATGALWGTATARNWDFPQRRQIFAGLRLAADA